MWGPRPRKPAARPRPRAWPCPGNAANGGGRTGPPGRARPGGRPHPELRADRTAAEAPRAGVGWGWRGRGGLCSLEANAHPPVVQASTPGAFQREPRNSVLWSALPCAGGSGASEMPRRVPDVRRAQPGVPAAPPSCLCRAAHHPPSSLHPEASKSDSPSPPRAGRLRPGKGSDLAHFLGGTTPTPHPRGRLGPQRHLTPCRGACVCQQRRPLPEVRAAPGRGTMACLCPGGWSTAGAVAASAKGRPSAIGHQRCPGNGREFRRPARARAGGWGWRGAESRQGPDLLPGTGMGWVGPGRASPPGCTGDPPPPQ